MSALLICLVLSVTDGDTLRCQSGERIRLAGVDANELDGTCHTVCAPMPAAQARDYLARWVTGTTVSFTIHGRSGKRLVGDNPTIRCGLLQAGAVVRWERYWRGYGLGECGR